MQATKDLVPPRSLTGRALMYLSDRWKYLIRYLEDGRLEIDNNLVENAIRPFCLGRRNWLFDDTVRGAEALAPDGRVVVVDFAIDDAQREHLLGTLFAVNMRSFGDTWTEPVIRGLMSVAGLVEVERTDLGTDRWIICGRKPNRQE